MANLTDAIIKDLTIKAPKEYAEKIISDIKKYKRGVYYILLEELLDNIEYTDECIILCGGSQGVGRWEMIKTLENIFTREIFLDVPDFEVTAEVMDYDRGCRIIDHYDFICIKKEDKITIEKNDRPIPNMTKFIVENGFESE